MGAGDALGHVEFAVLDGLHRGGLRSRHTARQIRRLSEEPDGELLLHQALRRCERQGLVRSERDSAGRHYELTAAGRARLRTERRFRCALAHLLVLDVSDPTTPASHSI